MQGASAFREPEQPIDRSLEQQRQAQPDRSADRRSCQDIGGIVNAEVDARAGDQRSEHEGIGPPGARNRAPHQVKERYAESKGAYGVA